MRKAALSRKLKDEIRKLMSENRKKERKKIILFMVKDIL
jgi:hypothetical protein